GAVVVAVPHAVLLLAMRRAHARIHVEQDAFRRTTTMDDIDPLAGQIGKSREVRRCCKPLRLETAHLAWRRRTILRRLAADNPAYGRIMPQALGVVGQRLHIGSPQRWRPSVASPVI